MSAQMNAIIRRIEKHPHIFDFDKGGLGEHLVAIVAQTIYDAMSQECSPKGQAWPALSEAYDEWKSRHFPGQPMAVLTGHMKQIPQLIGLCRIVAGEIRQTYGIDETARALATWFQEGNSHQPPRPFFMFGDIARALLEQHLDVVFARGI